MKDQLPFTPDIGIVSYLGSTPELRQKRLEIHIRQRQVLAECFPNRKILTIASNYTKQEKKILSDAKFDAYHLKVPTHKHLKHNLLLSALYASPKLKSMLLLDDDAIPRLPKEGDLENGLVETAKVIAQWFDDPSTLPAPCCYFACSGLKFDAFYKSEKSIIGEAPLMVTGWATWVRSDLGVLQPLDLYEAQRIPADDMVFRVACMAAQKLVLKHYRAFFRSLQGSNTEKYSTLHKDQKDRNQTIAETLAALKAKYPEAFAKKQKKQDGRRGLGLLGSK